MPAPQPADARVPKANRSSLSVTVPCSCMKLSLSLDRGADPCPRNPSGRTDRHRSQTMLQPIVP
jgi:hypothetical protein